MRALQSIQDFDRRWLLLLQQPQSWLALSSRFISRTADGYLYVLIGGFAVLAVGVDNVFLPYALLAFSVERVVYWGMKNSLKRARPTDTVMGAVLGSSLALTTASFVY